MILRASSPVIKCLIKEEQLIWHVFISVPRNMHGIAFVDISTGTSLVAEGDHNYIDKLLQSFDPAEIVLAKTP